MPRRHYGQSASARCDWFIDLTAGLNLRNANPSHAETADAERVGVAFVF